jgi:hypothetical protein
MVSEQILGYLQTHAETSAQNKHTTTWRHGAGEISNV